MAQECIKVIQEEHTALAAMLRSMLMMLDRGPGDEPENFFDVMRAMLFYIDEFPERLHHPKESQLLFPMLRERGAPCVETLDKLDRDHAAGERAIRSLEHALLAWEMLGEPRRETFEVALANYIEFYRAHMRAEEDIVLPAALATLDEGDWRLIDAAFAENADPLTGHAPDALYEGLFRRIVNSAPAPIGLG